MKIFRRLFFGVVILLIILFAVVFWGQTASGNEATVELPEKYMELSEGISTVGINEDILIPVEGTELFRYTLFKRRTQGKITVHFVITLLISGEKGNYLIEKIENTELYILSPSQTIIRDESTEYRSLDGEFPTTNIEFLVRGVAETKAGEIQEFVFQGNCDTKH